MKYLLSLRKYITTTILALYCVLPQLSATKTTTVVTQEELCGTLTDAATLVELLSQNKDKSLTDINRATAAQLQKVANKVAEGQTEKLFVTVNEDGKSVDGSEINASEHALQTFWSIHILKATELYVKQHFLLDLDFDETESNPVKIKAFCARFSDMFSRTTTQEAVLADIIQTAVIQLNGKYAGWTVATAAQSLSIKYNNARKACTVAVDDVITKLINPLAGQIANAHNFVSGILSLKAQPNGVYVIMHSKVVKITDDTTGQITYLTLYEYISNEAYSILDIISAAIDTILGTARADLSRWQLGEKQSRAFRLPTAGACNRARYGLKATIAAEFATQQANADDEFDNDFEAATLSSQ
jgi:hypothetical protein